MGKVPQKLIDSFETTINEIEGAELRKMFGSICGFANTHMFTVLHESDWIIRLPEGKREELLALPGAGLFEPMKGRPMKEYVAFPQAMIAEVEQLEPWLKASLEYVQSLPPKKKKSKKK